MLIDIKGYWLVLERNLLIKCQFTEEAKSIKKIIQ
tara:strand:+ start:119512 stop:119616 length:105 start_codon:yes stop_codon:yes gene_type:complete